jgi:hypothetical protein
MLMPEKYVVELSAEERDELRGLLRRKKLAAAKRTHAQILLKADQAEGGPAWPDTRIAEAFDIAVRTVGRVRERCVLHGLADALERRSNPRGPQSQRRLDGAGEARLCQLACSPAPEGREHWTLQLLADRLVRLEVVESISRETVRRALKKTNSSLGSRRSG